MASTGLKATTTNLAACPRATKTPKAQTQSTSSPSPKCQQTGRPPASAQSVLTVPTRPNPVRVHRTVGGDQIECPYDVSTKTAGLITAKIMFNSVISTDGAKCLIVDIKNFYMNNAMASLQVHEHSPLSHSPSHHRPVQLGAPSTQGLCLC